MKIEKKGVLPMASLAKASDRDTFTFADTSVCKGIAVLMMLFHHLFNEYGEFAGYYVNYWPFTGDQVITIGLICRVCVAVFVFITGFGLAASYAKCFGDGVATAKEAAAFSVSRWWKLMMQFWPVYVLAVLCAPLGRNPLAVYGGGIRTVASSGLIDFMGLAEAFHKGSLNPTWWYMSLAIVFIFIAPVVMRAVRAFDSSIVLVVGVMVVSLFGHEGSSFGSYIASYLLGVFCHEHKVFESWAAWRADRSGGTALKALISGVLLLGMLLMRNNFNYAGTTDAFCALLLCMFAMSALRSVPLLTPLLKLCGHHSTNMFLVHTLMYSYYFLGFYYSFQIPIVILAVLAATSMLVSFVLEKLENATPYHAVMERLGKKVVGLIAS